MHPWPENWETGKKVSDSGDVWWREGDVWRAPMWVPMAKFHPYLIEGGPPLFEKTVKVDAQRVDSSREVAVKLSKGGAGIVNRTDHDGPHGLGGPFRRGNMWKGSLIQLWHLFGPYVPLHCPIFGGITLIKTEEEKAAEDVRLARNTRRLE